jgi:hypothetical protein
MLCHQFSQNLISRLDLLLQIGDSFRFRLMVGASPLLKSRRSILETLLLPAERFLHFQLRQDILGF